MNRPWLIWSLFAACVLTVVTALAYVSVMVVQADEREAAALRRAAIEENVRLALWRLDAAFTPLLARENARPYEVYQPFYAARGAVNEQMRPLGYGQVLLPSPLRGEPPPMVRLHFQLDPATGKFTTPQDDAPAAPRIDELVKRITAPRLIAAVATESDAAITMRNQPAAGLDAAVAQTQTPAPSAPPAPGNEELDQPQQAAPVYQQIESRNTAAQQRAISEREYQQRAKSQVLSNQMFKGSAPATAESVAADVAAAPTAAPAPVGAAGGDLPSRIMEEPMAPAWIDGELFLLRRVSVNERELIQGVWLDWPRIESWMLAEVADVLPDAQLRPAGDAPQSAEVRTMASAPIVLALGAGPGSTAAVSAPIRTSLIVAWIGMVLAIAAVTTLLRGAMVLSERRGAFVSAVTHELRTPLTTFRLYTQMLADGMVTDDAKRRTYLRTLSTEAERLSHLVENVLTYARLERTAASGMRSGEHQRISAGELIGRMTDRLAQRCDQAGMQLMVEVGPAADMTMLQTDTAAVDRIVFNLIDNACKYARDAEDRRIELAAEQRGGSAMIHVRDHGPGIAPDAAKRMFRPFSKSAHAAAHSAPGVGLGLALSRRLARTLGGDLKLESSTNAGTQFTLILPAVF